LKILAIILVFLCGIVLGVAGAFLILNSFSKKALLEFFHFNGES
jgi:hypothetical protein